MTLAGTISRGSGVRSLRLQEAGNGTVSGSIASSVEGGLFKDGNGIWTISGTSAHTGSTTVNGGVLAISKPFLADGAGVLIASQAKMAFNFDESAFGLNPKSASSLNSITMQLDRAAGTFRYQRRDPALDTGFVYTVWFSEDLITWTRDAGAVQVEGMSGIDGTQVVAVTVLASLKTLPRVFIKVRAERSG